jgi:hypothetical protein
MQNLTWTGTLGAYINPFFLTVLCAFLIFVVAAAARGFSHADGPNPTHTTLDRVVWANLSHRTCTLAFKPIRPIVF